MTHYADRLVRIVDGVLGAGEPIEAGTGTAAEH
jgi:hypothetical protein